MTDSGSLGNGHGLRNGVTPARRAVRIFAIFATTIMLLTAFQILVGTAIAQTNGLTEPGDVETGTNGSAPGPIPQMPEVSTEDVQVFGSAKSVVVSDAGPILTQARLRADGDVISYTTGYGTYVTSYSMPGMLSLISENGMTVAKESYFAIESSGVVSIPYGGTIVVVNDNALVVTYDLVRTMSVPEIIGEMRLSIDFSDCKPPKITAEVLYIAPGILDWRVVWQIAVDQDSKFRFNDSEDGIVPIGDYANGLVPCDSLSAEIIPSNGGEDSSLSVDWSDAKSGELSVSSVSLLDKTVTNALRVAFQPGRKLIDPTMVSSTSTTAATSHTWQRKTFNQNGYFWTFYNNNNKLCYRNSGDGVTWSSEYVVSGSTSISPSNGTGFDVAQRGSSVAVAWYCYPKAYFKNGTILGNKIVWNPSTIASFPNARLGIVSVAIGTDFTYWISYYAKHVYDYYQTNINVSHSFDGKNFQTTLSAKCFGSYSFPWRFDHYNTLMPTENGNVTLLEKVDVSGHHNPDDTSVRVRYYWNAIGGYYGWQDYNDFDIYSNYQNNENNISAISTLNGTIHIVYKNFYGYLSYAYIYPKSSSQTYDFACVNQSISGVSCPTICTDSNNMVHIFYIWNSGSTWNVQHMQKIGESPTSWSSPDTVYTMTDSNVYLRGLTSWANPVDTIALAFTKSTSSSKTVMFISTPLPYGTSGSSVDPWSRDGISPYGTYFGSGGASVSPGSGQLFVQQMDVNVPGRNGMDVSVSRIYQQPRYFCNSNGSPYLSGGYPFCDLGRYWSLDLPWMSRDYVCVGGGMRFIIQWGNEGDPKVFENHGGMHFVLRNVTMGATKFFELVTSSGLRYKFDCNYPFRLLSISNLQGYNPLASSYANPYNCLNFSYNASNRLIAIYESGMNRSILFGYNANGLLSQITRPDGLKVNLTYTNYGGINYLWKVSDPKSRTTSYNYNSSANYLIDSITYPTAAKSSYVYSKDNTSATECFSWFVTKEILRNTSGGNLIRQTNVSYKIVNGKVTFANLTNIDENSAVASFTEYIFRSNLKYTSMKTKNPTGVQMQCKLTYYDAFGQPARIDTMKGSSQSVNYSEYTNYDDWGNVIFTRDALGHAVYSSYANTSTQNSFQGGDVLTRSSSGKIFYDAFDDWEFSDWSNYVEYPNSISLNGTKDPPSAPSLKLCRGGGSEWTNCYIVHQFTPQTGYFYIQQSFISVSGGYNRIFVCSGNDDNIRIYFRSCNGDFQYYTGSGFVTVADCEQNVWYDVGFYVRGNTYDIYIDGTCVKTYAQMVGTSGNFDRVRYYAGERADGYPAELLVDNVRIYKNLTVKINNLNSKYMAELFDGGGSLLGRSNNGTITIPKLQLNAPPAFVRIWKIGDYSFSTPMMDIWGGDIYSFCPGLLKSNMIKNFSSYGKGDNPLVDDNWPGTSTYTESRAGEGTWVTDPGATVSGNKYHVSNYGESDFQSAIHWHGFYNVYYSYQMPLYETQIIKTYVWLTYGQVPKEIMLQFQLRDGSWKRAYWGGNDTDGSDLMGDVPNGVTPPAYRLGDVPTTTGKWVELSIAASTFNLTGWNYVKGMIYGLYGGVAKWDFTCRYSKGISIEDVPIGATIRLILDDGPTVSQTVTSNCTILNLYGSGIRAWPTSGYFKIISSVGSLLYLSPHIADIYNWDKFKYSAPDFYPNEIKDLVHNRAVGTFQYKNYNSTTPKESYLEYDFEGNAIETKSKNGSGWVYTQSGYDIYGNQVWISDPCGRMSLTEYSSTYRNTYPISTSLGGRKDNFEFDDSWDCTISSGDGSWMKAEYSSARSYSPTQSVELSFTGAQYGPSGTANVSREFVVNPVATISVRMYVSEYSHSQEEGETMDSGVRMRLFDSNGVNFANRTYWLACWSQSGDNRTSSDPNMIVICGKPSMNSWISRTMHPCADWPNIDWGRCYKVEFQLYASAVNAYGDTFKAYYDDFTYDDFANNSKTTYAYNMTTGLSLSSTDPLGHTISAQYDSLGRVTQTNNSGSCSTATYDDTNNKVTLLDELGHKTVQYFDGIGRMIKAQRYNSSSSALYSTEYYTYNWQDKVKTRKDALGDTTYSYYDCLGRVIKVTNPDGTKQTVSYNDQASMSTMMDENGNIIVKMYDDLGRLNTTKEYNRRYTQYSASFRDDVGKALRATSSSWYASWYTGSASSIEGKGQIGVYPSQWQIFRTAQLFDTSGLPDDCVITDAYMAIWVWDKTSQNFNLIVQHNHTDSKPSSPVGLSDYDKDFYSGEGGNLSNSLIIDDAWNRVYLNADGQSWINETGTTKFMLRASFDINNQSKTSSTYVAWRNAPWSESLRVRLNVTYIRPNDYTVSVYETKMAYDAVGNLLTVRTSNGEVTRMYYDSLSGLTQTAYPDGEIESAAYDDAGNTISKTSRSGLTTYSSYDSSGKLFRMESLNDTVSYLFDADGKTLRAKNNCTTVCYTYDGLDQLTSMSELITATHNVSYGYDIDGKVAWVKYPNLVNISYCYDVFDRLVGVSKNGSRLLWLYYNLDDTVSKETLVGGQVTDYTYNDRGWVSKIETKNGSRIVLSLNYTYDGVGNVKTINYMPGVTEYYSYDNLSRLVRADGSETWGTVINYAYDSVGNRLWKNESGSTAYSYGTYNKLTSDGTWSYTYSRNGDLVWKNSTSAKYNYTFNSLGQMTKAYKWVGQDRTLLCSFSYDVNGARAKTIEGGKTTEYVYAGHDPVCEKLNNRYTDYVYVNGHMKFKMAGECIYGYISDALGSTRLVFNGSVKTYSVEAYKPFGTACGVTGSEKFTFAGEMNDTTGLFYLFARYYDPEIGRFISIDLLLGHLSSPQTLNRYIYCSNNPLIYTDPAGTKTGRSGSNFKWEPMSESDFQAYWDSIPVEEPSNWLETVCDLAFTAISFIPVVGNIVSTAYFVAKDIIRGDWASVGLSLSLAFIPGGQGFAKLSKIGSSLVKAVDRGSDVTKALRSISLEAKAGKDIYKFNDKTVKHMIDRGHVDDVMKISGSKTPSEAAKYMGKGWKSAVKEDVTGSKYSRYYSQEYSLRYVIDEGESTIVSIFPSEPARFI